MSVSDSLARKSEEARAVFYSVVAYRHIVNVSIERAVELYMSLYKIDMVHFDRIMRMYSNAAHDAREFMDVPDKCKTCPEV